LACERAASGSTRYHLNYAPPPCIGEGSPKTVGKRTCVSNVRCDRELQYFQQDERDNDDRMMSMSMAMTMIMLFTIMRMATIMMIMMLMAMMVWTMSHHRHHRLPCPSYLPCSVFGCTFSCLVLSAIAIAAFGRLRSSATLSMHACSGCTHSDHIAAFGRRGGYLYQRCLSLLSR
jgi:hypothetical protein